ncbi:MAG: 3-oxoadipate enol-lactonase [Rhodocyclaceae bacterium]|nr:3-oxoadipate enol-lactonase [Rhodocyclaceae bacterium]
MKTISLNGIDIAYQRAGSGPAVLFAHSLASDHSIWQAQVEALAASHTAIAYDLRGHGKSSAPPGPYSFRMLAEDAAALLDALGIEKASFVGISLGGMIGQAFALDFPERLEKLVLADTTAAYPAEARALWAERIRLVRAEGLASQVQPTLERWFTPAFRAAHPQTVARIGRLIAATPLEGYIGCCEAIATLDFLPRLPAVRAPTLVLVGEQDAGTPPAMARQLAERIPAARLAVIPGAAHLSCIEQAERFSELLIDFLAR